MDRAKIVNYYIEKSREKDFTIIDVRRELERNNFEEDEIKIIVKLVDNQMQRQLIRGANKNNAAELIWLGAVVTIIGSAITIGTYTGMIRMGNSYLLAYGPVLGGLSIMFYGIGRKK